MRYYITKGFFYWNRESQAWDVIFSLNCCFESEEDAYAVAAVIGGVVTTYKW